MKPTGPCCPLFKALGALLGERSSWGFIAGHQNCGISMVSCGELWLVMVNHGESPDLVTKNGGTPSSLDGFWWKNPKKIMDDDWGYPRHVWKPRYTEVKKKEKNTSQWMGLRENLQGTIVLFHEIWVFPANFPSKQSSLTISQGLCELEGMDCLLISINIHWYMQVSW